MDAWYMDDSSLITTPYRMDQTMKALDQELAKIGVARGLGEDIKSTIRIVCPIGDEEKWSKPENQTWITPYIRNSCKVLPPNAPTEYLGTMVGGIPERTESMKQAMSKTAAKRAAISNLGHAASEMIMLRRVTDVSNINYWLR